MKKYALAACAAAALAAAGCGEQPGGPAPDSSVQPSQVDSAELRSLVTDEQVRRFYSARGWQAAWTGEAAAGLVEALDQSHRHGLDPRRFKSGLDDAADPTAREAALSKAAFAYAGALADGLADPGALFEIHTLPRSRADVAAGLSAALENGDVRGWLAGLAPQDEEYRALSDAFLHYSRLAAQERAQAIGAGEAIEPGDRDPRVAAIVAALRANDYLPAPQSEGEGQKQAGPEPTLYTPAIAAAVRRLQQDYGLEPDGVVGSDTLAALNAGAADRARQLAVNLERRRWLDRRPPETRIDVNTAAALLDYWHDGSHRDHRRVVVGQPGWETPELGSPIFRLVANPTWTVPRSIEEEEIAPKGAAYMRRNNMVRRDGMIVQLPGPDNALGQVKLDMRNDQAIYLHDTPAKALFGRNQRHSSHGCVRVADALGFARMLAAADGKSEEFERALATGEETFVALERQVPVRLLYHSVFVDRAGNLAFRTDPYGWDDRVAQALGLAARDPRTLPRHVGDIGP